MGIPKELAKSIGRFHTVHPEELDDFNEQIEWLEALLHEPCSIWVDEDGSFILLEIRQLVERLNGLKIEIYSDEHAPPHFHVKYPNVNASFSIEDCALLNGKVSKNDYLKIRYWHQHSKDKLIKTWNETRPYNCVVGQYRENQ